MRIIRQIKQVEDRLSQIELEFAALIDSDIAKLKAKSEAAAGEGRDLLSEMASDLTGRIKAARSSFESRLAARVKA